MNSLLARTAVLVMAVLFTVPANAQSRPNDISESGNRFLEVCSVDEKPMAQWNERDFLNGGVCEGFMMGLRDGIGMSIALLQHDYPSLAPLKGSIEDLGVCFPDGSDRGQMIRVTLKYIRQHPEQSHLPSAELVFMAELDAFPCTRPTTSKPSTQQP
jgi:Ssp1 endopeptidase immunity protein Rap1a